MIANITTKSMVDTIVNAFGTGLTPLFYSSEPKDPNGNEGYYIAPATGNYTLKSTRSYARYLSNTGQLGYGLYFNSTSSYSTASGGNPEATKSAYLVKGQKPTLRLQQPVQPILRTL